MNVKLANIIVFHNVFCWLPATETWLYTQVFCLPKDIQSHIICEVQDNLNHFDLPNIYCLKVVSKIIFFIKKTFREIGIPYDLPYWSKKIRQMQGNILHSHFGHQGWSALYLVRNLNLKHVVTFYGMDVNQLPYQDKRWLSRYQKMFQEIDQVLCEGPHMAQCIVKLGCPSDKVIVHRLGVNIENFPFCPRVWSPGEPLRILMAASFREKKGLPYALQALGKLNSTLNLDITLIGDARADAESQREKQSIIEMIAKYKLRVKCLGYQSHQVLIQEIYQHHLFLSPSVTANNGDTEGGAPVAIIEAAATGMPIISTRHCDIPGVLKTYPSNLLANERDVEDLVRILNWWMSNTNAWEILLLETRKYIEQEFDAERQGEKLGEIYRNIITKNN